jgi:type I restriction enzyme S subunit
LNILLPSLPEQKAIARVLSSFDDKIELLRAENHTLEEMGQTLFKEWFGKYKVEDELPDGWKW